MDTNTRKAYNEALKEARFQTEVARRLRNKLIADPNDPASNGSSVTNLEDAALLLQRVRGFKTDDDAASSRW